jgi:hypothetical protein
LVSRKGLRSTASTLSSAWTGEVRMDITHATWSLGRNSFHKNVANGSSSQV